MEESATYLMILINQTNEIKYILVIYRMQFLN
jgi:hypothetical protein